MATIVFFPEGAYGPTNNCVGIGDVLAAPRTPRRLRDRGVVRGHARGARASRSPDAPRAAARARRRSRASSGRTSSATRRPSSASRRSSSSRGSSRRPGRRSSTGRSTSSRACGRSSTSCSRTSSSRTTWSPFPRCRRPGGPGCASCPATRLELRIRPCRRCSPGYPASDRTGWDEFRAEYQRTHRAMWEDFDAFVRGRGARRAARPRVHPRVAVAEPLPLSRGGRLRAGAAARPAPGIGSTRASAAPTRTGRAPEGSASGASRSST